jgi:hypothetical protein
MVSIQNCRTEKNGRLGEITQPVDSHRGKCPINPVQGWLEKSTYCFYSGKKWLHSGMPVAN